MSDRGFTLLELLIACALLLAVAGAVAAMAAPLRDVFERSLGATDMTGGGRVALERLVSEVREAGSGASVGHAQIRLSQVVPAIVALSDLGGSSVTGPGRAVRITGIPLLAPQGVVRTHAATGTTVLELETAAQCSASGPGCGLRPGTPAVLHDAARALLVTVHSVADPGLVRLTSPLPTAFDAGSVVAAVAITEYGVRTDPDGSFRLVRSESSVEQPVLQNVVDFAVAVHGADAFRIHQVDLRLRIEAASAALRGTSGRLFRRPGTSRHAARWVPDVEITMSVAPRNLAN